MAGVAQQVLRKLSDTIAMMRIIVSACQQTRQPQKAQEAQKQAVH